MQQFDHNEDPPTYYWVTQNEINEFVEETKDLKQDVEDENIKDTAKHKCKLQKKQKTGNKNSPKKLGIKDFNQKNSLKKSQEVPLVKLFI